MSLLLSLLPKLSEQLLAHPVASLQERRPEPAPLRALPVGQKREQLRWEEVRTRA